MTDRQPRTWTDAEVDQLLDLAFDTGRHYERARIADAVIDLNAAWPDKDWEHWLTAARDRRETLVAARAASHAPSRPDWLETSAARLRRHDEATLAIGARMPPVDDYRVLHAHSDPRAWERLWYDMTPAERATVTDLAPASATGRIFALYQQLANDASGTSDLNGDDGADQDRGAA